MSFAIQLRLGLALTGLVLFGYGAHADVSWLRWTGICFLGASLLARFLPGGRASRRDADGGGDDV